jgi:hypothetical protein
MEPRSDWWERPIRKYRRKKSLRSPELLCFFAEQGYYTQFVPRYVVETLAAWTKMQRKPRCLKWSPPPQDPDPLDPHPTDPPRVVPIPNIVVSQLLPPQFRNKGPRKFSVKFDLWDPRKEKRSEAKKRIVREFERKLEEELSDRKKRLKQSGGPFAHPNNAQSNISRG